MLYTLSSLGHLSLGLTLQPAHGIADLWLRNETAAQCTVKVNQCLPMLEELFCESDDHT